MDCIRTLPRGGMYWKIHFPRPKRFSKGGDFAPRPSRLSSGFALGQSLGPRGAKSPPLGNLLGLGGCIFQYIPPLGSVRIQYYISLYLGWEISISICHLVGQLTRGAYAYIEFYPNSGSRQLWRVPRNLCQPDLLSNCHLLACTPLCQRYWILII